MNSENKNTGELSADQQRYLFLTKQAGLEYEEALYALGRRNGAHPKYRNLTWQEQSKTMQEFIGYGLTEQEAQRILGLSSDTSVLSHKSKSTRPKKVGSLDWMPAKKAYNSPWPARSHKGLLK